MGATSIFPNARQDDIGQPFDGVDGVGSPERPFYGPQVRSAESARPAARGRSFAQAVSEVARPCPMLVWCSIGRIGGCAAPLPNARLVFNRQDWGLRRADTARTDSAREGAVSSRCHSRKEEAGALARPGFVRPTRIVAFEPLRTASTETEARGTWEAATARRKPASPARPQRRALRSGPG